MATWQFSSKCNNLDRPDAKKSRTYVERERETPPLKKKTPTNQKMPVGEKKAKL
jgi:hypothetical protein